MRFKKIAIFCAPKKDVIAELEVIKKILLEAGYEIIGLHGCTTEDSDPREVSRLADLILVLGGDGTILYASKFCQDKPILGVNYGKIGFLSEISPGNLRDALRKINENEYWIQELRRLKAKVNYPNGEVRELQSVLNEYLLFTSALAKMISIEIFVDQEPITKTRGDGLIIATPIGSSAYALSAGGPILLPDIPTYLIVPLAPLWGKFKSMVLSDKHTFSVKIREDGSSAVVVGDGLEKLSLPKNSIIHFQLSDEKTSFIRFGSRFEKLSRLMLII